MKKNNNYYLIAFVIILLLVTSLFLDNTLGSRIVTVITVSTAVLGAVSIFIQYKRDKNVNQATFILEYGKYFYSLNKAEETAMILDEYRLGNKAAIKNVNYAGVINYLFWCEELSTLYQKNVIDLETIDNIFSYNFFLITNNNYIQELEIIPQKEFYKGIFYLHKEWTDYKKKTGQPIINQEESLEKTECYLEYAAKGDIYNKKTF